MKTASTLLIFAGLVVFAGIFSGEYYFKGYSARENVISDLGQKVDPINASSKSSIIFNSAMVIAGISIFIGAYILHSKLENNFVTIPLMIHGIATAGVGVFPSTIKPFHIIFAILTFLTVEFASIAAFSVGEGITKYMLAAFGTFSFIFLIGNFAFVKIMGSGTAERLIVYPTTIWLIIFGIFLLYCKNLAA